MPLTHLQTGTGGTSTWFLYDGSWLHKKITIRELDQHGWHVTLLPGVATALARLSALLQPVLEHHWAEEVRRFNQQSFVEDHLEDFLFGGARVSLDVARGALYSVQAGRCFYCRRSVPPTGVHVDHVLPWCRTRFDDLANYVVADQACNLDKRAILPAAQHIHAAAGRDLGPMAADTELTWSPGDLRARAAALFAGRRSERSCGGEGASCRHWTGPRRTRPWPT